MEELVINIFRTVFIYFFIMIVMRAMGKREMAKLSIFDLVVFIMVAEMAAMAIENPRQPLLEILVPIFIFVILQISLSYLAMKKDKVRDFIEGRPALIIENGKINDREMQRQRYDISDLVMQLHEHQVKNVADVEFAILETSGKLSVFTKEDQKKKNTSKETMQEKYMPPQELGDRTDKLSHAATVGTGVRFKGMPLILISDSKVLDENLRKIQQNRFWLKNIIQKAGYKEFKEVYFASIDEAGNLYVDGKDYHKGK